MSNINIEKHCRIVEALSNLSPTQVNLLTEAVGYISAQTQEEYSAIVDSSLNNSEAYGELADLAEILEIGFALCEWKDQGPERLYRR